MPEVSVAIPVRDGGALLAGVLRALARQTVAHELVVCDSGSRDGSRELAAAHGARVIEIAPHEFSHGRVRNLLMRASAGAHVAFLTQDAEPAAPDWLASLLSAFAAADDVALAFGPYRARPDAATPVRLELDRWFALLAAPDGGPHVERLARDERDLDATALVGARGFFTDANGCVARAAWERVPYRDVAYAEDRALALDMLRAGYAKAYVPAAAVLHSHAYTPVEQLRRSFDEWRGLLDVYGWREPLDPRRVLGQLRGELGQARRQLAHDGEPAGARARALAAVLARQAASRAGALLGSRADVLPPALVARISLERRAGGTPGEPSATDSFRP